MIRLVTGSGDTNTVPSPAIDYAKEAAERGLDTQFVNVRGAGHRFDSAMADSDGFQNVLKQVVLGK